MTFRKSKLTPEPEWSPEQKNLRKWYKALIAFRKAHPCWQSDPRHHLRAEIVKPGVMKATGISNEHQLFMWFNFTKNPIQLKAPRMLKHLCFQVRHSGPEMLKFHPVMPQMIRFIFRVNP